MRVVVSARLGTERFLPFCVRMPSPPCPSPAQRAEGERGGHLRPCLAAEPDSTHVIAESFCYLACTPSGSAIQRVRPQPSNFTRPMAHPPTPNAGMSTPRPNATCGRAKESATPTWASCADRVRAPASRAAGSTRIAATSSTRADRPSAAQARSQPCSSARRHGPSLGRRSTAAPRRRAGRGS